MNTETLKKGIFVLRPGRRSFHWTDDEKVGSVAVDGTGRVVSGRSKKKRTLVKA